MSVTPEIRRYPTRDKSVGGSTWIATQDERRSTPGKRVGPRGAPVAKVRLFDALRTWAEQTPDWTFGDIEVRGSLIGNLMPAQDMRSFLGASNLRYAEAYIESAYVSGLYASGFVETQDVTAVNYRANDAGFFRWYDHANKYVGLRAPLGGVVTDTMWQLPDQDGSAGDVLVTDGAGALGWAAPGETAAAILAKLLTVDGAGSGLDADTLDGQSSAAFAAAAHVHSWSDVSKSGSSLADLATRSASDLSSGTVAAARGGLGLDTSGSSGIPVVASGTWSVETPQGTGAPVRANSPALVTPALGTPSSGNLSSCTNVRHWITSYCDGVTVDTTRKFMPVGGYRAGGTIFNTVTRFNLPACTLREMRFWCQAGPGVNTYTVRWNNITAGTTSSFTVTAGGATTSSGLSVSVAAGDLVVWDIVASAGSVLDNLSCMFLLEY